MNEIKTNGEEETFLFAKKFASVLRPGDMVCLSGGLGAGKTVFTKGVCEYFGVREMVSSPTFTIVNEYAASDGRKIYHFDMYRLEEQDELIEIGFDEYLNSGAICLVEWPENIPDFLPAHRRQVTISRCPEQGDDARTITVEELF